MNQGALSDEALLLAIRSLWERLDPPPDDLADGVIARLAGASADLDEEYELLTLVESADLAGVRSVETRLRDRDEVGSWSLEYVGPEFRVYLRISRTDDGARLDGWVVPPRPLTVRLSSEPPYPVMQQTPVSELGRFEFPGAPGGACRLTFIAEPRTTERPHVTPPFWI